MIEIKKANLEFRRQPHKRDLNEIDTIVLHHSASPQDRTIFDVHQWHLNRGWFGCGYHFVIHANGEIYEGRSMDSIGAHARGHNRTSIGICVIGNFEETHPTVPQRIATGRLVAYLINKFASTKRKNLSVKRHKDIVATLCPGRNFRYYICDDDDVKGEIIAKLDRIENELIAIRKKLEGGV